MSAMNETPENVTSHLISPKDQVQRIPGEFVNCQNTQFVHIRKLINLLMIPFYFQRNINSWICIKQPHNIL